MNLSRATQLTLVLGGFFGEDVAREGHGALDRAAATRLEPLGGAAFGFHFWHVSTFDYVAAAGDGTIPHFEPEVDLFAPLYCRSGALLEISVSFWVRPSSPSDGPPFLGTARPVPIPLNLPLRVSTTPFPIPDAPFRDRENVA